MNYEKLLLKTYESGYVSVHSALFMLLDEIPSPNELNALIAKVRRLLTKGVNDLHLQTYKKDMNLKIYGLTKKGREYLESKGFTEIKSTTKTANDSVNVRHRIIADSFSAFTHLLGNSTRANLGSAGGFVTERTIMQHADYFSEQFGKVPDGLVWINRDYRRWTWLEIDKSRRKPDDMRSMIKFIDTQLGLFSRHFQKSEVGSPDILLWVCEPSAYSNAVTHLRNSFKAYPRFLELDSENSYWCDFETETACPSVFVLKLDMESLGELPDALLGECKAVLEDAYPVDILHESQLNQQAFEGEIEPCDSSTEPNVLG